MGCERGLQPVQPIQTSKGRPQDGRPDPRLAHQGDQRLALIGLPPALIEPVTMLAEIMGWQVLCLAGGPVMRPPARLCLAVLPGTAEDPSPLAAWSPDTNLNEHISQLGLSRLDHPPCLNRLELLLQLGAIQSAGSGRGEYDAFQNEHPRRSDGGQIAVCNGGAGSGNSSDTGFDSAGSDGQSAPGRDVWQ
jgi:hypothetical protein